jgi:nuclear receptor interaction protein
MMRSVLRHLWLSLTDFVPDRAFGGRGIPDASIREQERQFQERQNDIDPLEEDDDAIIDSETLSRAWQAQTARRSESVMSSVGMPELEEEEEEEEGDVSAGVVTGEDDENEDSDGDVDPSEGEGQEDDDDGVDSDGLARTRSGRLLWRSDFDRSYLRERVESHVPASPHTRIYTGHCNVRTVKDVNFFGQQDEYVVSGSDCGHLFIWDRKTANLVNILEGDGEVVNVVQGQSHSRSVEMGIYGKRRHSPSSSKGALARYEVFDTWLSPCFRHILTSTY